MATTQDDKCPVDHKSREAWLEQARAASTAAATTPTATTTSPQSQALPPSHPSVSSSSDADSCPVDHNARQVWLEQAQKSRPPPPPQAVPATATTTTTTSDKSSTGSSWSSYIPSIPFLSSSGSSSLSSSQQQQQQQFSSDPADQTAPLGTRRQISTIPRSSRPGETSHIANQEQETGSDAKTGNWIYPSERMFFEAMKRKGHDPQAPDMQTVVPIHNAVNERAWQEIKQWEAPWIQGTSCQTPRLHSFSGLSTKLSPKARVNTLLGYQAPFDRHDWVVDRCGTEIEYIIDFYAGRPNPQGGGGNGAPSFYLDVRPKLNSWEGVKMRAFRAAGLS
ncbi:cytochrome c/c1 heme-lyase [Microdochium bolleyi]|uniref:Holocytochrome c-type synthase n=1 Tax=Microdochium bolleyi TaxID=196109 RepID=A0A136JHM5_9PEZI|nr:cytochrome c/c1 heme-lyase [Microdochium bolleyi]